MIYSTKFILKSDSLKKLKSIILIYKNSIFGMAWDALFRKYIVCFQLDVTKKCISSINQVIKM